MRPKSAISSRAFSRLCSRLMVFDSLDDSLVAYCIGAAPVTRQQSSWPQSGQTDRLPWGARDAIGAAGTDFLYSATDSEINPAMQSGQPSSAWHMGEIEARSIATIKHFAICSVFNMIIPLRLCLEIVRVNPVIAPNNRVFCRFAIRGRTQNVDIPGTGTGHLQQLIPDRHVRRVQL